MRGQGEAFGVGFVNCACNTWNEVLADDADADDAEEGSSPYGNYFSEETLKSFFDDASDQEAAPSDQEMAPSDQEAAPTAMREPVRELSVGEYGDTTGEQGIAWP
eukprot:1180444-Prorocentrum_minimum.AAC.2